MVVEEAIWQLWLQSMGSCEGWPSVAALHLCLWLLLQRTFMYKVALNFCSNYFRKSINLYTENMVINF